MGQAEIIKVLEESERPLSCREVAKKLNDRFDKVIKGMKKLLEYEEVKCIELDRKLALKYFKSKRRLRLYYINKSQISKTHWAFPYI